MWKRSSGTTDCRVAWLGLAVFLLVPLSAFADKKDDLYKQAQAAASAGKVEEAARLYCELAKMDAKYKDAQLNCNVMKQEAERERKRNEDRFQEGVAAFNAGRWDDAEQKFRNIRGGPRLDEAKQYLASRIPAAKAAKANEANEAAMSAKFDDAVGAYQSNNFNSAKSLFGQISGRREGEARNYLNKIREYEQAMGEGDRLASASNFRGALQSFNDAATIKPDGPGDPRGKAQRMQTELAKASGPAPTTTTVPPPTTTTATTRPPVTTPSSSGPTPSRVVEAAVKEPARPQVDVAKLLREAESAKAAGNIPVARSKYLAALGADPSNRQARLGLETLPKETGTQAPKATSEADILLARAIGEFYQGKYDQAEVHIRDYLEFNGSKTALSQFYLGVTKLTKFYLNGERADERRLINEAGDHFKVAKKTAGFTAPDNRLISPKILKAYQDITP
jgi:tetratricopeptide (TPR) repeat protein